MDHKLRVIVRLDMDSPAAVLDVTGCLTTDDRQALIPVTRRAGAFIDRHGITVGLTHARHVEAAALTLLRGPGASQQITPATINIPATLPACPARPWMVRPSGQRLAA